MKKANVLRAYYVLPCCLLLLNLITNLISYKADMIADPFLRIGAIMLFVLFGGTLVAYAVAPGIEACVRSLHHGSRRGAGTLGEIIFFVLLGLLVFWLYYQFYIHGPESLLPKEWWNHPGAARK